MGYVDWWHMFNFAVLIFFLQLLSQIFPIISRKVYQKELEGKFLKNFQSLKSTKSIFGYSNMDLVLGFKSMECSF